MARFWANRRQFKAIILLLLALLHFFHLFVKHVDGGENLRLLLLFQTLLDRAVSELTSPVNLLPLVL